LKARLLLAVAFVLLAIPAGAAASLHVIPFPGTPDASAASHIIFSSLKPAELTSVIVSGSSSGAHHGQLVRLPHGSGTAFIPDDPFTAGESVSVSAVLSSPAAGTASGDPGATALHFSFIVATPPSLGAAPDLPHSEQFSWTGALGSTSAPPGQTFRSAPDLQPPVISATADRDPGAGDIFLTPRLSKQQGPIILDSSGRLLWFRPINGFATNLQVQRYLGQPVLTWFQQTGGNRATNEDVVMNRSYDVVAAVHGVEGYVPDEHEFQLGSNGTAWIDAYTQTRSDLTSVGGPSNGVVMDGMIQERDVRTGQLLWEWHALGHIPLSASFIRAPTSTAPYDYFHINSIQELPKGNLLISARNTWAVYEIARQTGRVIWSLGGRHSSFRSGTKAGFEWQHDARLEPGGVLSVFDDASDPTSTVEPQSSGKIVRLNMSTMTASLVGRFRHTPPLRSEGEGSAQILPDHNFFIGWGQQPVFTEYAPNGREIFNGSFPLGITSYRAYRFPWKGEPPTRPSLAISAQPGGADRVYVSWNGATEVAAWRVLSGARPGAMHTATQSRRTGFETVLSLRQPERYLAVQAINARGKVLATSAARKT
jgi:hypothetical protein